MSLALARAHVSKRLPYTHDLLLADQEITLQELVATLPPTPEPPSPGPEPLLAQALLQMKHNTYLPDAADASTAVDIIATILRRTFEAKGVDGVRSLLSQADHFILCQAAAVGFAY